MIAGFYTHKNKDIEENNGFTSHNDSTNLVYRHNGFTLGAGVFIPVFGKKSNSFLSFYGGINKGNFKMTEEFYHLIPAPSTPIFNKYQSSLNRYFLQGSLNYYGNPVEASVTTRYNLVEYKKVVTDYTDTQLSEFLLPPYVSRPVNSFIDFSMDLKIFFSHQPRWGIMFFGMVTNRTNKDDEPGLGKFYYYYPFRIGTGIFFRGSSGRDNHK